MTTLVNTHHHGDHTYGNSAFGAVTIVGHENCRTELIAAGPPANRGPLRNCLAGSHVRPAQGVYGSRKEADRFLPPHQLRKCAIREGKAMPVVPYYLARPANVWITAISLRNSARQEGGERADG